MARARLPLAFGDELRRTFRFPARGSVTTGSRCLPPATPGLGSARTVASGGNVTDGQARIVGCGGLNLAVKKTK
jgi:hypothetical protein